MSDQQLITIEQGFATLNITWNNQNGDLPDPVPYDSDDQSLKNMAAESIMSGGVPGIAGGTMPDFSDYIVDRFSPTETRNYFRLMLRPKTPFGGLVG